MSTDFSVATVFPTSHQPHKDVFEFVASLCSDMSPEQMAAIGVFVTTARRVFTENAPVAMDFTQPGLSLRLQDGTVLPFCAGLLQSDDNQTNIKGVITPQKSWGITG